ncbi:DNA primase [Cupriavidus sp. UYMSc13B]|nr:DNA primase [Cupriavidus sp. UYMSc13B]
MRYLAARVPGLRAPRPKALRLAVQDYWYENELLGRYPTIVAQFTLPDGRMATVHRTSLDPELPAKATVLTRHGEILPVKRNDVSALPLAGGAVRLMQPRHGEIGVAEGLENAYAAYMLFGVPAWNCLNRVLLRQFVVPQDLGIHTVHIFADFDRIDPKTGKSPGMADALALQKRLRAEGLKTVMHRPKVRGTDFCDQWRTEYQLRLMSQQAITA